MLNRYVLVLGALFQSCCSFELTAEDAKAQSAVFDYFNHEGTLPSRQTGGLTLSRHNYALCHTVVSVFVVNNLQEQFACNVVSA